MKNNFKFYLLSGVFLTCWGLKGEFILLYNGIALILAAVVFYQAFLEYKRRKA